MAGPNLEVFKFGLYLFIPVVALMHFGDAKWYRENVLPYKDHLFPAESKLVRTVPTTRSEIQAELERFKAERRAKRTEREEQETAAAESPKRLV